MCDDGARKTHVMYRCNLNSKQISEYLNFLIDCGMLDRVQEHSNSKRYIFKTSELGKRFIRRYKQMAELFNRPLPPSILSE